VFEHSDPFKDSPGSHSQLVSCSVDIISKLLASAVSTLGLSVFLLLLGILHSC